MISGGAETLYHYDTAGNLLRVIDPAGEVIDYLVDGRDRRVGKRRNGRLVQGWLYLDALSPVAELDGQGQPVSIFVYARDDHTPEYLIRDGRTYRILSDHIGSPRLIVDVASGAVIQRMDYDANGRLTMDSRPGFQPFGFAGGLYDPDTGLTRFGSRDYDPDTGHWTTPDSLGFAGGDSNLYRYALGDPVNRVDRDGRFTAIAGAIGGFAAAFVGDLLGKSSIDAVTNRTFFIALKAGLNGAAAGFVAGLCGGCALGVVTGINLDLLSNAATGASIVNSVGGLGKPPGCRKQ